MGLISRLKRITGARIDAFLDGIEDPSAVYPQLLRELDQHAQSAQTAVRKAAQAVEAAQRRIDESEGRRLRYQRGAKLALDQGDEETSREALRACLQLDEDLAGHQKEHARSEEAHREAAELAARLEAELRRLREQKDEILERAHLAQAEAEIERAVEGLRDSQDGLLEAMGKVAVKVRNLARKAEQQVDAAANENLDQRLRRYEREAEVDRRLRRIRRDDAPQ